MCSKNVVPVAGQAITENELFHALHSKAKTKKIPEQTTPAKAKKTQNTMQSVKTNKSRSKLFNTPIRTMQQNQQGKNSMDSQEPISSHINLVYLFVWCLTTHQPLLASDGIKLNIM